MCESGGIVRKNNALLTERLQDVDAREASAAACLPFFAMLQGEAGARSAIVLEIMTLWVLLCTAAASSGTRSGRNSIVCAHARRERSSPSMPDSYLCRCQPTGIPSGVEHPARLFFDVQLPERVGVNRSPLPLPPALVSGTPKSSQ